MTTRDFEWKEGNPALALRIQEALTHAIAEDRPIQSNSRRSLYRLTTAALNPATGDEAFPVDAIAKIYHAREGLVALRESLKRRIRASPAAREGAALKKLAALDLNAPRVLARGHNFLGEEILVTSFLPGRPLADAIEDMTEAEHAEVAESLVRSLGRLHEAGFIHGDLHLGNLLCDASEVALLDVGRFHSARQPIDRVSDWAALDGSLARSAERSRGRASALGPLETFRRTLRSANGLGSELDRARIHADHDYQRGRARRLFRTGRRWQSLRFEPNLSGFAESGVDPSAVFRSYKQLSNAEGTSTRRGGRVRIQATSLAEQSVVAKRVASSGWIRAVADRFRGSAGARAFRRGQMAELLHGDSARVLAFVEERRFGIPLASWCWMEHVGEADFDEALASRPGDAEQVSRALGRWLGDAHARGVQHRDVKATNIRLTRGPDGLRFWLVDLEDLDAVGPVSESDRIQALSELNASIPDADLSGPARWGALEAYAERCSFDRALDVVGREIVTRSQARRHRWQGIDCDINDR